ncbi:MAG: OST-HTH/LOTUS domain-containing protein [Anaerolineae bacterium]|nr:OST-HTH/LOTUS domain-containing protein [Anaerolineae bacterium]
MGNFEDEYDDGVIIDTICAGCDLFRPVNDLSLCDECFAKLERDLIRSRDWTYSATAFMVAEDQLEALRERVIRDHGAAYELIEDPHAPKKRKGKNRRSHSRSTQRKREIAAKAIRDYDTETVLQSARDFLRQQDEEWMNFSRLAQHLYETFYKLKPKHLGPKDKKYKSLLKFIADYPDDFEVRQDDEKKGLYWVRLFQNNT